MGVGVGVGEGEGDGAAEVLGATVDLAAVTLSFTCALVLLKLSCGHTHT